MVNIERAPVAQMEERLSPKEKAAGSIPVGSARYDHSIDRDRCASILGVRWCILEWMRFNAARC